jgi:hypothetical protein
VGLPVGQRAADLSDRRRGAKGMHSMIERHFDELDEHRSIQHQQYPGRARRTRWRSSARLINSFEGCHCGGSIHDPAVAGSFPLNDHVPKGRIKYGSRIRGALLPTISVLTLPYSRGHNRF